MMFFKRMIARWVDQAWRYDEERESNVKFPPPHSSRNIARGAAKRDYITDNDVEFKNPLNITLYNAMGGKIVKFHSYDRETDQSNETTYIIQSELDFEKELGKCIAMESLKHKL